MITACLAQLIVYFLVPSTRAITQSRNRAITQSRNHAITPCIIAYSTILARISSHASDCMFAHVSSEARDDGRSPLFAVTKNTENTNTMDFVHHLSLRSRHFARPNASPSNARIFVFIRRRVSITDYLNQSLLQSSASLSHTQRAIRASSNSSTATSATANRPRARAFPKSRNIRACVRGVRMINNLPSTFSITQKIEPTKFTQKVLRQNLIHDHQKCVRVSRMFAVTKSTRACSRMFAHVRASKCIPSNARIFVFIRRRASITELSI